MISGFGAQQATGAGGSGTTCASSTPGSGYFTLTTTTLINHGIQPGEQFTLSGMGGTGTSLNVTYVAAAGSTGTTLIGVSNSASTCPTGITEGLVSPGTSAANGLGGTFTLSAIGVGQGSSGITMGPGQRFCAVIGEYGADLLTPGKQFVAAVDHNGNALPGSPAVSTWLNQGNTAFTGTITTGLTGSITTLTVTSMQNIAPSAAAWDSGRGGEVVLTYAPGATTATPLVVGTVITASGFTTTTGSFSGQYAVIGANTSTATITVIGLQGVAIPATGTFTGLGTFYGNIQPGMSIVEGSGGSTVLTTATDILPYGTSGGTGTGGTGTYLLSTTQSGSVGSQLMNAANGFTYSSGSYGFGTTAPVARTQAQVGDYWNIIGGLKSTNPGLNSPGWGGSLANIADVWGVFPNSGGTPSTASLASLCTKQQELHSFVAGLTVPGTVHSLYRLNDPGRSADSSVWEGTGTISGTTFTPSTTTAGATTGSGTVTLAGDGITGCPSACPTFSLGAGPTYTLSSSGGTISSPEKMVAGNYAPAKPIPLATFGGYISGTTLTVPSGTTGITPTATLTGAAIAGTTLTFASASGTVAIGQLVYDVTGLIANPLLIISGSGLSWQVNAATNGPAVPSTGTETMYTTTATLLPGEYVLNSAITTPVAITSLGASTYELAGTYNLSNSTNGTIGSSGSLATFTAAGATSGAAIAPGPALTISPISPGASVPITNYSAMTGQIYLSGTYSTSAAPAGLGGTPSAIQAQISSVSGGPPVAGCSACAWTNVSSPTLGAGSWSGQAVGVPMGGPYYVSIRAANGTAYATMPGYFNVGFSWEVYGEGNTTTLFNTCAALECQYATSWGQFSQAGVGIANTIIGPLGSAVFNNFKPVYTKVVPYDRFGMIGSNPANDALVSMNVGLQSMARLGGYPAGAPLQFLYTGQDGTGTAIVTEGGQPQAQTIAVGDGSSTVFCSGTTICANFNSAGALNPNFGLVTGAQITGTISQVSGVSTLNVATRSMGGLSPGLVLSGASIVAGTKLLACTAGCSGNAASSSSKWSLDTVNPTLSTEAMTAAPVGGAIWPQYSTVPYVSSTAGYGDLVVREGSFSISVNGVVVCTDTNQNFDWSLQSGTCTDSGGGVVASSFINYATGGYSVTFNSAPANGAAITASWTSLMSSNFLKFGEQIDYLAGGPTTSANGPAPGGNVAGAVAALPNGPSAHSLNGCNLDGFNMKIAGQGYPIGALGLTQTHSSTYGSRWAAAFPHANANIPVIVSAQIRAEAPGDITAQTQIFWIGSPARNGQSTSPRYRPSPARSAARPATTAS